MGGFKNPAVCAVRDRISGVVLGGPGFKDYRKLADETMTGIETPAA